MEMRFEILGLFETEELIDDHQKRLEHYQKRYADTGFLFTDTNNESIYKHYNYSINLNVGDEVFAAGEFCIVVGKWYNADENYMHYVLGEQ